MGRGGGRRKNIKLCSYAAIEILLNLNWPYNAMYRDSRTKGGRWMT